MIIKIIEPNGSVSTTIPLCDIDHVETRTLSFFGEKVHNLYLVLKKGDCSYFHLLTFLSQSNRDLAEKQLSGLLQHTGESSGGEDMFELIPSAAPVGDGEIGVAL